jgi:hypothetical protein
MVVVAAFQLLLVALIGSAIFIGICRAIGAKIVRARLGKVSLLAPNIEGSCLVPSGNEHSDQKA